MEDPATIASEKAANNSATVTPESWVP